MRKLFLTLGVATHGLNLAPISNVAQDRVPGTISNITGLVNDHELDIVNIKTLDNLMHQSWGIWNSTTPGNPSVVDGGGSAIWRGVAKPKFGIYTAANRANAGELKASKVRVKIDLDDSEAARYEIETLDLPGLNFENRQDYISFVASGVTKNLAALMDAHYMDIFVKDAIAKKATGDISQLVVNANFSYANYKAIATTEARTLAKEDMYLDVSIAKELIAKQLTEYDLGTNEGSYVTLLEGALQKMLLLAMPKGGDSATEIGRGLNAPAGSTTIAGLGLTKDHILFDRAIATTDPGAFSSSYDFDFTNVHGLIAHSESAFLATQGLITTGVILPGSHNQEYLTKFNKFKGIVRDTLYNLYVSSLQFGGDLTQFVKGGTTSADEAEGVGTLGMEEKVASAKALSKEAKDKAKADGKTKAEQKAIATKVYEEALK